MAYNIGQGVQGGITGAGTGFAVGGPVGAGVGGTLGLLSGFGGGPKKEKLRTFDPYSPEQRAYSNQLLEGAQGQQANVLNYLNSILSDNPELLEQFEAPAMQNFQRRTVPGILERFNGNSSALNQTLGEAGKELQLGLSQQRANLKQNALQQLLNMGQLGLQQGRTPYIKGGTPGLNSQLAPFAAQGFQQMSENGGMDILGWLREKLGGGGMQPATSAGVTGGGNQYG